MDGITQFKKIKNVGIFKDFSWPVETPELKFKEINFIYGHNGSGKSTLSNIISLFSDQYNDISSEIATDSSSDIEIEIEWDGKVIKFPKNKKEVYIFNSVFVADHVYDGTRTKVKPFKNVVTKEQLSNPTLKGIKNAIDSKELEKEKINDYKNKIVELTNTIRSDISSYYKDVKRHRMPNNLNLDNPIEKIPDEDKETLERMLSEELLKAKKKENPDIFNEDTKALKGIQIITWPDFSNIISLLKKTISNESVEKVEEKIDKLKNHKFKHSPIQNWLEDGVGILKNASDTKICPLCDSTIVNIEKIITLYDRYFNNEFEKLIVDLSENIKSIELLILEVNKKREELENIKKIIERYGYKDFLTSDENESFKKITSWDLESFKNIKNIFDNKKSQINFIPTEKEIQNIQIKLEEFKKFKINIAFLVSVKDRLLTKLREQNFNPAEAKVICSKLFWKRISIEGELISDKAFSDGIISERLEGIKFLKLLNGKLQDIHNEIIDEERKRNNELAQVKRESKYINSILSRLSITNFEINVHNSGDEGITIIYKNASPRKEIQYSLSDGEKTALAFAYFISKYKLEVLDNTEHEEKHIIVIDDPVSSLDENRIFSTAKIIQDFLVSPACLTGNIKNDAYSDSHCEQFFILSHNLIFLKFMSNILYINNDKRGDFYMEKGKIMSLPNIFQNYQTSYFYKFKKILDFSNEIEEYEHVKDCLPNFIRIVLESFLSFKFARLRLGRKDKIMPAMLDDLIKHLENVSFAGYTKVNTITDGESLKSSLWEIKDKVNPESHGTIQDITDMEYFSEDELRYLAKLTIDVIKYLDRVHYDRSTELAGQKE